jgi:hypothetical protein
LGLPPGLLLFVSVLQQCVSFQQNTTCGS